MNFKQLIGLFGVILCMLVFSCTRHALPEHKLTVAEVDRVFWVDDNDQKTPQSAMIFLDGLVKKPHNSQQVKIAAVNNQNGILTCFPLGLKGAFPAQPKYYAWGPDHYTENLAFIKEMIEHVSGTFGIPKNQIILAGFSNGAFFLSQMLQKGADVEIAGYWIQGGGNSVGGCPALKRNVYIEIGVDDNWHIAGVRRLQKHLKQCGWVMNRNLEYREFEGGHVFNLQSIDKVLEFLLH